MKWKEQQLEPQVVRAACEASPEEVNYDGSRLEVLNRHIQSLIDDGLVWSGSYCLWRHGRVFADAAIGTLACTWQGNNQFLPDTLFEIQSIGKLITAIAILKLMEDGILYLGQPVKEWIPEFAEGDFRQITILHLLTHTSGICALEDSYPQDVRKWWEHMDEKDPKGTWISAVVKTGLHAKPGEKWIYSIISYSVLGEIIQRATGMEAEEYIRQTIFLPCEMRETHWRKDGTEEWVKRYNIANETDLRLAKQCEAEGLMALTAPTYPSWPGIPHTAGGQMSTAREMVHLGEMILRDGYYRGKRVIGKKALSLLWNNMLGEQVRDVCFGHNQPIIYGPGVPIYSHRLDLDQILSEGTIYHEGAGTCVLLIDKEEDFVAMFQTSFRKEFDWNHRAVKGTASIIWSGIK